MVLIKNIAMGEFFEGFYLIKSVELRRTRAGKDFLAIVFQDRTGTISGNIWDANPKAVKQFVAGRVVHMKALKELLIELAYVCQKVTNQLTLQIIVKNRL